MVKGGHALFLCLCVTGLTVVRSTSFALLLGADNGGVCEDGEDYAQWLDPVFPSNWEVNGCNGNCTIRVPVRNCGPDNIPLGQVQLKCAGGDSGSPLGEVAFYKRPADENKVPGAPIGEIAIDSIFYQNNEENKVAGAPIGEVAIDSIFTPIKNRRFLITDGIESGIIDYSASFLGSSSSATADRKQMLDWYKAMQETGSPSFSGGFQAPGWYKNASTAACPEGTLLQLGDGTPTVIPAHSEVLLEVEASIPADVRVVVSVGESDESDEAGGASAAVVDLLQTSVADILNRPYLCCIKSVRTRVLLGRVIAEALEAYGSEDAVTALHRLRFFLSRAKQTACGLEGTEPLCLEQAVAAAMSAARMIAEEFGMPERREYELAGDYLRRRGEGEAAVLSYEQRTSHRRRHLSQYAETRTVPAGPF